MRVGGGGGLRGKLCWGQCKQQGAKHWWGVGNGQWGKRWWERGQGGKGAKIGGGGVGKGTNVG